MMQYLEDLRGTGEKPLSSHEREELDKLRKDAAKLKEKLSKDSPKQ
jgi:hypothetical protein